MASSTDHPDSTDGTTETTVENKADSTAETKPSKAERKAARAESSAKARQNASAGIKRLRSLLAQVLWLLFLLAALFLAVGALLIALDANRQNDLVHFVLEGARKLDLGVFSKDAGIKQFGGSNAETKNALFNWGLGAVAWLVVGRIVDRIVKP